MPCQSSARAEPRGAEPSLGRETVSRIARLESRGARQHGARQHGARQRGARQRGARPSRSRRRHDAPCCHYHRLGPRLGRGSGDRATLATVATPRPGPRACAAGRTSGGDVAGHRRLRRGAVARRASEARIAGGARRHGTTLPLHRDLVALLAKSHSLVPVDGRQGALDNARERLGSSDRRRRRALSSSGLRMG